MFKEGGKALAGPRCLEATVRALLWGTGAALSQLSECRGEHAACAVQVLDARRRASSEYYAYFLDQLSSTVR